MSDEVFFNKMVTKGLEPIESDGRFFEGYLTVQVKDKQGEVTIVDELYKVLPIWMDRGAPITDTHSNRVIGKGINFARSDYTDANGDIYPAIKVTGKIYKDYELDNEIWRKIKSGEYKGLSFGGSTKTDREPMRMKDGSIAYSLSKLEHYEVAVCKDPAVPLAVITDVNPIAKANMNCDHTGCYVTKPILGEPNFEAATRKVMEESNVPKENAKRIVGAAENKKAVICKDCGLPKKIIKGNNIKPMTCPHCGESTQNDKGDFPKYGHINRQIRHDPASGKYSIDEDSPEWDTFSDYKDNPHGMRVPEGNDLVDVEPHVHHYAHQVHQGHTPKIKHPAHKRRLTDRKEQMEAHFSGANKGRTSRNRKRRQAKEAKVTAGMKGTFKSIVDTNKILGKFQGNAISLARILDKGKRRGDRTSPSERFHFQTWTTSGRKKDKPRKGAKGGNEKKNRKLMETMSPEVKLNYQRNMEAMAAAGKDKKSKKKIKKVGSSLPESGIDPNQANQGAGFGMRNQTPPKRKMEAKLGDGTYDYSS